MASFTQQLILELAVKDKNLQSQLRKVGDDAVTAGEKMDEFQESTRSALEVLGQTALAVGVGSFVRSAVNAYGELINVQQTAKQVFGDSYETISEFSKGAVEAVGLSERAALEATTYIAGLGKAAGVAGPDLAKFSEDIVRLGADLAAAFNTDVEQAIGAIQSGFSGSSVEPLRRYNIVINDTALKQEYLALTGEKVTGVLTQQQRAAAFVSLLYQNSADYLGQWDRESQQFLGTQTRFNQELENFRAGIGQSLEPVITGATNSLIDLLRGFQSLDDASGGIIGSLTGFGLAFLALVPALNATKTAIGVLFPNIASLGTALKGLTSVSGIKGLASSLLSANPAMLTLGAAAAGYAIKSAQAAESQAILNDALDKFGEGDASQRLKDLEIILRDLNNEAQDLDGVSGFFQDVGQAIDSIGEGGYRNFDEVLENLDELAITSPEVVGQMLAMARAGGVLAEELTKNGLSVDVLTAALENGAGAREDFAREQEQVQLLLDGIAGSSEDVAEEIEVANEAFDDFAEGLGEIAGQASEAKSAIEELLGQIADAGESRNDIEQTALELQEALAAAAATYFSEMEEGETASSRRLDQLNAEDDVMAKITENMQAQVAEQERLAGKQLEGQDLVDAQLQAYENIATLFADYPLIVDEANRRIAELGGQPIEAQLDIIDNATPKVEEFVTTFANKDVAMDLLIDYADLTPEEAQASLDRLSEEQVTDVVVEAVTTAAENDISSLEDEDYIAEIVAQALLDEAEENVEDFTARERDLDINVQANLRAADEAVRNWLQQERSTSITVDVQRRVTTSTVPSGDSGDEGGGTGTSQQLAPLSATAVQAGQPIVYNATINVPTADPSAVVRAVQTWSRRNGALPIMRGRG